MEDSWRYPPIRGSICPTCSISHFPFCLQPPSFDPSFHRPFLDSISNNRGIPRSLSPLDTRSNSMRPIKEHPIDAYNDHTFRMHRVGYRDSYGGNEFMGGTLVESDRFVKRMRVGEMGSGNFSQTPPSIGSSYSSSGTRLSAEDERRLSLIRDHGAPSSQTGMDSKFEMGSGYVSQGGNRVNGYSHESSYGNWRSKSPSFYDPVGGSADIVGQVLHEEPVFDTKNHTTQNSMYDFKKEFGRSEFDLHYDQQKMQNNMDGFRPNREDFTNRDLSFFQQSEGSGEPRLHSRYSQNDYATTDPENYFNTFRTNQEKSSAILREEEPPKHHISHGAPYLTPQDSVNAYQDYDYRLQATGFNQANEFLHTHVDNSPLSSRSGIPIFETKQNIHSHGHHNDARQSFDVKHPPVNDFQESRLTLVEQFGAPNFNTQETYLPKSTFNSMTSNRHAQVPTSTDSGAYPPLPHLPPPGTLSFYPPLPPLPPPSLPLEPLGPPPAYLQSRVSPPNIPFGSPDAVSLLHPPSQEGKLFQLKNLSPDKPKTIDASSLFKRPTRDTRPDHIVVILRGLPGSGKSYLAKMLRDLEVENGANAPRIHSMDDYFMTEVEKVEESEVSKSSGSVKGKKRVTKKVMEYCYEPEMEEAYRSSMLKAFKKTLEDGIFTFIIVDDRNLRVADFAQFWASAKRSGYEVYLLEAMYKDPVGCAARNIHGFTSDDIQKMAEQWEEAPSLYLRLDIQSLFHGDNLKEDGIQEVDMDMDTDDVACDEGQSGPQNINSLKSLEPPQEDCAVDESINEELRWDAVGVDPGVTELKKSKWSRDADEEDVQRCEGAKRSSNALSGLIQAYTKKDKSVHWGDQVDKTGFSIGANKRANVLSIIIGPGAGYNLKSNPLPEEETESATDISWQSKKRSVFEEQLRAERASERESFKSVVDRRRQRIGGLELEDELQ